MLSGNYRFETGVGRGNNSEVLSLSREPYGSTGLVAGSMWIGAIVFGSFSVCHLLDIAS